MNRISPFGFWRYGKEFLDAAKKVKDPTHRQHILDETAPTPAYFLVGHSIELSLKSFLLSRGEKIEILRSQKFGHNLEALLKESKRRKLGREVKVTQKEKLIILILNENYKKKNLEYFLLGYTRYPRYALVFSVAKKINDNLKQLAEAKTKIQWKKES